jgi:hypothetical protein
MHDWRHSMNCRRVSPGSDSSSTSRLQSPASGTTESTSVSGISDAGIYHKRKGEPLEHLFRKQPRMELHADGRWMPFATDGEVKGASSQAQDKETYSASYTNTLSRADLPASIWQRVFTYLPPQSLGQLLLVNRTFNSYLQAAEGQQSPISVEGKVQDDAHMDPEKIWIRSRRLHHRHLPRPLHGRSELDMWKLIGGRRCQFCVQKSALIFQSGQTDSAVRGSAGQPVRIFWPLAIRCCNACLWDETLTVCRISQFRDHDTLPGSL